MTSHNLENISDLKSGYEAGAYELLALQLHHNITGTRARHFNPGVGENGAYRRQEKDVQNGVNRMDERQTILP
jgi:hypothetical protein